MADFWSQSRKLILARGDTGQPTALFRCPNPSQFEDPTSTSVTENRVLLQQHPVDSLSLERIDVRDKLRRSKGKVVFRIMRTAA
jgi:hypothetical protein